MPPRRIGRNAEEQALFDYQDAGNDFVSGGAAKYKQGEDFKYQELGDLERLGNSQYENISTDPRFKNAELDALRSLEERSSEGLTKQDEADMLKLRQDVDRRNRGRQGMIQQNMAQRGMSGSGLDLVAQLQAGQDATEMEALASIEKAAQSQNNKRAAAIDLGNMSGQMQSKEFAQQAQRAQAADEIARYNNQNTNSRMIQNNQGQNSANQANWGRANQVSDNNVNSDYNHRKDTLGVQQGNAQQSYNYATEMYNRQAAAKAAKSAKKKGQMGAILGVAGGIAGGVMGSAAGPMGTAMGASAGASLGSSLGNAFAFGGTVPGPEIIPFQDDPQNDVFHARLSPGEVVLPKSIAKDPTAAASFVAKENAKAIDPAALSLLEKTDPDLVARYRTKMSGADRGIESAQNMLAYGSMANTAGKLLNDFGNSQKEDVILHNNWQSMGQAPKTIAAERKEYDGSAVDKLGALGVSQAEQNKKNQEGQFFNEEKLTDLSQSRADQSQARSDQALVRGDQAKARDMQARKEDPASEESAQMREFIKANYPGVVPPNFDKASASFLESKLPMLAQKYQADENRKARSEDRQTTRENTNAIREAAAGAKQKESETKQTEKMEQLRVGDFGFAQTADDAKKLKDAVIVREKLNRQLDEIVALREKHNGGATWNREDVATAKQLSTDAKLAYKDLVNLGVLSTSDTGMLDKILPDDPLEYNISGLVGQDPTMKKIKNFQTGNEADFQKSLGLRLRREGRSGQTSDTTTETKKTKGATFDWEH